MPSTSGDPGWCDKHSCDMKEVCPKCLCGLTHDELIAACKNIGFDLSCGACACVFFTGHGGVYEHEAGCFTAKATKPATVDVGGCHDNCC